MHDRYIIIAPPDLLVQAPILIVVIAGLFLSAIGWRRQPSVCLRVATALVLILIGVIGSRLVPMWLGRWVSPTHEDPNRWQRTVFLIGLATNVLLATAVGLFLCAALGHRPAGASSPGPGENAGAPTSPGR